MSWVYWRVDTWPIPNELDWNGTLNRQIVFKFRSYSLSFQWNYRVIVNKLLFCLSCSLISGLCFDHAWTQETVTGCFCQNISGGLFMFVHVLKIIYGKAFIEQYLLTIIYRLHWPPHMSKHGKWARVTTTVWTTSELQFNTVSVLVFTVRYGLGSSTSH